MNHHEAMKRHDCIISTNLGYRYTLGANTTTILDGVSFTIKTGEFVALAGPSGSGKTTLLTLLGGLKSLQSGGLSVLGQDLTRPDLSTLMQVRSSIGFIFQSPHLMEFLTAAQNVQITVDHEKNTTLRDRQHRCRQLLAEVGLEGKESFYPSMLSGGQKQRVAFARALAIRPRLLLADEPTASLDRATAHAMIRIMRDLALKRRLTVLLATHDHMVMDMADRLITIGPAPG